VVTRLAGIMDGSRPPGLYRWRSRAHPAAIRRHLAGADIACYVLDGARVYDAASLIEGCATLLRFPGRFNADWDGMAEALADLSWLSGDVHVLIWEHYGMLSRHDSAAWDNARRLLGARATTSGETGPSLYVLLRGPGPTADLPVL
jgi:hypothetical protein